ncbi:MAG: DUF3592 domain-containing protein [Planctomycetia bacterium]
MADDRSFRHPLGDAQRRLPGDAGAAARPPGGVLLLVLALAFSVVPLSLLGIGVWGYGVGVYARLYWNKTEGRVVRSEASIHETRQGRLQFAPSIDYTFDAGGRSVAGNRYFVTGDFYTFSEVKILDVVKRYPAGAAIPVYYDPADPENCTVDVGPGFFAIFLVFPFALFFLSAMLVGWLFSRWLNPDYRGWAVGPVYVRSTGDGCTVYQPGAKWVGACMAGAMAAVLLSVVTYAAMVLPRWDAAFVGLAGPAVFAPAMLLGAWLAPAARRLVVDPIGGTWSLDGAALPLHTLVAVRISPEQIEAGSPTAVEIVTAKGVETPFHPATLRDASLLAAAVALPAGLDVQFVQRPWTNTDRDRIEQLLETWRVADAFAPIA